MATTVEDPRLETLLRQRDAELRRLIPNDRKRAKKVQRYRQKLLLRKRELPPQDRKAEVQAAALHQAMEVSTASFGAIAQNYQDI